MHFLCARLVPKSFAWVHTFSPLSSPREIGVVTLCSFTAAAEQETTHLLFVGLALVLFSRAFAFESVLDLLHMKQKVLRFVYTSYPHSRTQPSFIRIWAGVYPGNS